MILTGFLSVVSVAAAWVAFTAATGWTRSDQREPLTWVEDTFEDFRDGQFASGADLYVTRRGEIKTVNRFDLNGDGHLDLVFNTSHDEVRAIPPTCHQFPVASRTGSPCELPALGTRHGVTGDLDRDGTLDLVLVPSNNGVTPRRYLSIFWGGKDGWTGRRRTGLLAIKPLAVDVGDLDGDQWPEIVVLNGSRWAPEDGPEAVLRIYWGSEQGYRHERHTDVAIANAVDLKVRDLDADGRPEVVVLLTNSGQAWVYWNDGVKHGGAIGAPAIVDLGTPAAGRLTASDINADGSMDLVMSGGVRETAGRDPTTGVTQFRYSGVVGVMAGPVKREWDRPQIIAAPPSSDIEVADLDEDGFPDLILADASAEREGVHILWGDVQGLFQKRPISTLPVSYGAAVAAGDIDGDDNIDLAVGVARGEHTYQGKSQIFFGDGSGHLQFTGLEIDTAEVSDVIVARGARGTGTRVIFCNNRSGRINEDLPIRVYWGGPTGFRPERLSLYSIRSGYVSAASDLNDDGYADLIPLSIVHTVSGWHPMLGFNILWGGSDGLNDRRRTIVPEYGLWGVSVADLDRDGYLDLVGNCPFPSPEGDPARVVIWSGGPKGFIRDRRSVLRCDGAEGQNVVADFNQDGYLDIAVNRRYAHCVTIFWGSKEGFAASRQFTLPLVSPGDLKTADLDQDGWLDLIVSTHRLPKTNSFDFGLYIFWGGPGGFRASNAQRLPAQDAIGVSIADFDGDKHLDIYAPAYHYGNTRESVASRLFWGSAEGFSDLNRTELIQDAGTGSMAGDFNGDGRLDPLGGQEVHKPVKSHGAVSCT